MFAEFEARLDKIEEMIRHVVRVGEVVSASPASGTVRVRIGDADNLVSYDLPVIQRQTLRTKDFHSPDVGEHVLCAFLPFGVEQGFVLGSMFSQADGTPVQDPDKRHTDFGDGSWVQYDLAAHRMQAHVEQGELRVSVGKDAHVLLEEGNLIIRAAQADIDIDTERVLNLRGREKIITWTDGGMQAMPYVPTSPETPEK